MRKRNLTLLTPGNFRLDNAITSIQNHDAHGILLIYSLNEKGVYD
jgi:hypothetical protein